MARERAARYLTRTSAGLRTAVSSAPMTEEVEQSPVAQDPAVATIGDIVVSKHWVVTPNGTAPIGGSTWQVTDLTWSEKKHHPVWTIVLAVVLFPIGLLFLFITKAESVGILEVSVRSGSLFHATQVHANGTDAAWRVRNDVNTAQTLSAAASA